MTRMQADGHDIHRAAFSFVDLASLSPSDLMQEFNMTDAVLQQHGMCRRPKLFRPPMSSYNAKVLF